MKKLVNNLIWILGLIILFGCSEDRLDFLPKDKITDLSYWKTEEDFFKAMVSTYSELLEASENVTGSTIEESDRPTLEGQQAATVTDLNTLFSPTSRAFYWFQGYALITKTNLILANLDNAEISDEARNIFRGEASFLRGFAYYNLARKYGGVPILLEPNSADGTVEIARSPRTRVWSQAITDFNTAAELLPKQWDDENLGRPTKGAALGYLGIAKMWTGDWAGAETVFQDLFDLDQYSLEPNYRKAFSYSAENGVERLFEIQFRSDNLNTGWGASLGGQALGHFDAPRNIGTDVAPWGGWGENVISAELCTSFEPGDDRRAACILGDGETYYGETMAEGVSYTMKGTDTRTGFCCTKYWYGPLEDGAYYLGINFPLLRFSEILLHYAEVLNELGRTSEAYPYINRVRKRALLDDLEAANDYEACLDAINTERRHEIYHETNFFFDLVRTDRIESFLRDNYDVEFKPHWKLGPIPQSEIDKNSLLEQNPGY